MRLYQTIRIIPDIMGDIPWIDVVLFFILFAFALYGWICGAIAFSFRFLSVFLSVLLFILCADHVLRWIRDVFGIVSPLGIGILTLGVITLGEWMMSIIFNRVLLFVPRRVTRHALNRLAGSLCSFLFATIVCVSVISFLLRLPLRFSLENVVDRSFVVSRMVSAFESHGGALLVFIDRSAEKVKSVAMLISDGEKGILLDMKVSQDMLSIDEKSEQAMFYLVNQERSKQGVSLLELDATMTSVARSYATQIFIDRLFSHYDKDGRDVAHRLTQGNVRFFLAGENLAYAPNVKIAHEGLMKSDGHRRNIIDQRFSRIGIGVMDAGMAGKMFVQVFAD